MAKKPVLLCIMDGFGWVPNETFGNADAVPQPPERCLSRQAGFVRYCLIKLSLRSHHYKQLAVGSPFAKLNYPCGKFH